MSSPEKKTPVQTKDDKPSLTKENSNNTNIATDKKPLNPEKTDKSLTDKVTASTVTPPKTSSTTNDTENRTSTNTVTTTISKPVNTNKKEGNYNITLF